MGGCRQAEKLGIVELRLEFNAVKPDAHVPLNPLAVALRLVKRFGCGVVTIYEQVTAFNTRTVELDNGMLLAKIIFAMTNRTNEYNAIIYLKSPDRLLGERKSINQINWQACAK